LQVSETKEDENPKPTVHIDEHSDPDATIVEMCFGDRLDEGTQGLGTQCC
jgi:hypothetical protein